MAEAEKQIDFHFLKSSEYRSYHADGVVGSVTPRGGIYLVFYLERAPIPQKLTMELKESGELGEELASEGKSGVIRELECGVAMDVDTADRVSNWLARVVREIKTSAKSTNKG